MSYFNYRKAFYARIDAEEYFDKKEMASYNPSDVSGEFESLEKLKEFVKKSKWIVGKEHKFTIFDFKNPGKVKKVKLKIKAVEYWQHTEKSIIDNKLLKFDSETGEAIEFKSEPSKKVMLVNVHFQNRHDIDDAKTYTIATYGDDYMDRLCMYFREHNIPFPKNEDYQMTISFPREQLPNPNIIL